LPFVQSKEVVIVNFNDMITHANLEVLKDAINLAKEKNACCIIILLDTYGGRLDSTFEIIKLIDRSEIPIISYIYPKGATAWSAGTLILVSSHIAAMSENTIVGSSQPISNGEVLNQSKILNAIISFVKTRMQNYGRNESLVEEFVLRNLNINEKQALELGAIDLIAKDIEDLLLKLDGKIVKISEKEIILKTQDAKITYFNYSVRHYLMKMISNPIIASLLILIGVYAIIFGISSPGVFSEVVGAILIILGLIGLGYDVNLFSVILIIFGVVLLLYEIFTPGFGLFGITGIISIIIGISLLPSFSLEKYFVESSEVRKEILSKIILPSIIISAFFIITIYKVIESRLREPFFKKLEGREGIALENFGKEKIGWIKIEEEIWQAKSKEKIKRGEKVKVISKDGPILIVKRLKNGKIKNYSEKERDRNKL